jgi:hypothetical protein
VFANGVEEKRDELPPHRQDEAGDELRKGGRQGFNNTVSYKPAPFSPTKSTDTKCKMFLFQENLFTVKQNPSTAININ